MSARPTIHADDGHKEIVTLNADIETVDILGTHLDGWAYADIGLRLETLSGDDVHCYLKDGTWTVIDRIGDGGWMATDIPDWQANEVIEKSDIDAIKGIESRDGEYATIEPGMYEIASYGDHKTGHTDEQAIATERVTGRVVETYFEGCTVYNILVNRGEDDSTIIIVPHTDIEETWVEKKSENDCPQCDDQATDYPETVVEDSAGTHLVCPYCEKTIKSNVGEER